MATYRIVSFGSQLGIGTTNTHYVNLMAVAKSRTVNSPYCLPNELICMELGRFLRLPVAPGAVVRVPQNADPLWFAALDFSREGESLPPANPARCIVAVPDLCAGTVALDMLIANPDRMRQNIGLDESAGRPRLHLYDHERALCGDTPGQAIGRLEGQINQLAIPDHCLAKLVTDEEALVSWFGKVQQLPDFFIEDLCREAMEFGLSAEECEAVIKFLKHRRNNIRDIFYENRNAFRGLAPRGTG